jgi:spore germination cell wall hydrolase CwlJ-like protein
MKERTEQSEQRMRSLFKKLVYPVVCMTTLGGMAYAIATGLHERSVYARAAQRAADIECLAENVYYESRGEPLAGQYAVAEVTMNRVASRDFPNSVCAVVHQRGAFSWTYANDLAPPHGYEWRRAKSVAGTVYDNGEAPLVKGALYYHATRISPDWAPTRSQVALIGRHLFYL